MDHGYFNNESFLNQINDPNVSTFQEFNQSYFPTIPTSEYNNLSGNFSGTNFENVSTENPPMQQDCYQENYYNNSDLNQASYTGPQFYSSQAQCNSTDMPYNNSTRCENYITNDGNNMGYYTNSIPPISSQYQLNSNNNNNTSEGVNIMQNSGYVQQQNAAQQQSQKPYGIASGNQFCQVPITYSTTYYQTPGLNYTTHYTTSVPHNHRKRKTMNEGSPQEGNEDPKLKGVKKRKKKSGNEPQKPVSAYALFFRDTQAVIKSENPNSTFGEISKLVASMWDSLSEESKQVYKQKTEAAKRDYLKQLASFRANLISQGGLDQDEEDQPLSVLQGKIKETHLTSSPIIPPPPKLQLAPSVQLKSVAPAPTSNISPTSFYTSTPSFQNICLPPENLYNYSSGQYPQQTTQSLPPVNTWASAPPATTTPPPIQLRNIVPKAHSPVSFIANKPGQIIKVVPANQIANIQGKNKIIKMTDLMKPNTTVGGQSVVMATQMTSAQETYSTITSAGSEVQPILQMLTNENSISTEENNSQSVGEEIKDKVVITPPMSPETIDLTDNPPQFTHNKTETRIEADIQPNRNSEPLRPSVKICLRAGCDQFAISDPQWVDEYCSNKCVVSHCRDVFDAWTSLRQATATSE